MIIEHPIVTCRYWTSNVSSPSISYQYNSLGMSVVRNPSCIPRFLQLQWIKQQQKKMKTEINFYTKAEIWSKQGLGKRERKEKQVRRVKLEPRWYSFDEMDVILNGSTFLSWRGNDISSVSVMEAVSISTLEFNRLRNLCPDSCLSYLWYIFFTANPLERRYIFWERSECTQLGFRKTFKCPWYFSITLRTKTNQGHS